MKGGSINRATRIHDWTVTNVTKQLNRRLFLSGGAKASLAAVACQAGFGLSESPAAHRQKSTHEEVWTLALEEYAKRGCNYCDRMVDKNGLPYFDVFWTEPAEAAHDWPDFGDVMSRQFQAVIMARHMTGEAATIEPVWRQKILSLIDPETGLLTRPETTYSKKVADDGDQALTLYALVTAYADSPDPDLRKVIVKMTDGLVARAPNGAATGFILKSLMTCGHVLGFELALKLAALNTQTVFNEREVFTPDNTFRQGGHMHGNLRTLVGAADYALYAGDPVLFSRVDAIYRYVRSEATRFGFLPEVIGRKGDIVATETCALMDYLGLAVTLANHGHPEYWGDVERVVRNQLIENQARNLTWLKSEPDKSDTDQFTWRDIASRMEGGWAGWSSPTHLLAARETLGHHWGGPELHNKTRAFQNCCGGSGIHALYIAWKNAARFENGALSVNLHIDKLLPQAEIRGFQPFEGLLTIQVKQACEVRVRVPDFVPPGHITVGVNGESRPVRTFGNYLEVGACVPGEVIKVAYPLPPVTEEAEIGNPGFRHYHYRVTWKGDTVVSMEPVGNEYATGYSEFDNKQVEVFYGKNGPGQLYQREQFLEKRDPQLSPLHLDDGSLDFWAGLDKSRARIA